MKFFIKIWEAISYAGVLRGLSLSLNTSNIILLEDIRVDKYPSCLSTSFIKTATRTYQ